MTVGTIRRVSGPRARTRALIIGVLMAVLFAAAPSAGAAGHVAELRFSGTLVEGNCSAAAGETFEGTLQYRTGLAPNSILSPTSAIWGIWTTPEDVFTVNFSGGSQLSLGAIWQILVEDIPAGGTSTFGLGDLFEPAASTATTTYGLRLADPTGSGLNIPAAATLPTAAQVLGIPPQSNFPFGNHFFAFDSCGFAWGYVNVRPAIDPLAALTAAASQVADSNTSKALANKIATINALLAAAPPNTAGAIQELADLKAFTDAKTIPSPPKNGAGKTIPSGQAAAIKAAADDVCVALSGNPCP